jgi:peroxiredoxin
MNFLATLFTLSTLPLLIACTNSASTKPEAAEPSKDKTLQTAAKQQADKVFAIDTAALFNDHSAWYNYHYYNIHLAQNFTGLDADSTSLDKKQFLEKLTTGKYVALKTRMSNNLPVYQLYAVNNSQSDISRTMQQLANNELVNFKMEGKELPDYNFTDLDGNRYTTASTKGKLLVVKCWFINCVACVKEFPELNKLVQEYRQRKDILFLSLATDAKADLQSFLIKRPFAYAVVAGQEAYMSKQLGITQYPTHLLINKEGKIVKVVNTADDLVPFLAKEAQKITL